MTHLPRSSFSSSSSSSSDFTSPHPPNLSSPSPDHIATQSLPTSHRHRKRAPSEASLRFRHKNDHIPFSTNDNPLVRLLLAPVPLTPSPSLYLSSFPPAANVFHSLLALLAKQPLPRTLHNLLTTVSVHPHLQHLPPMPPKDAVAVDFVRAIAEYPPRIPVELRTAFHNMYTPARAQHVALLVSFAAYYSTIAQLLGLTDPSVDSSTSPFEDNDIIALTEPSEMSAPSSTAHSRSSSTKSLPKRISSAKTYFLTRLTHPLRLKIARHATRHLERSTWLSDIPTTRRSQDDFIRATMGFTPEYLAAMRNPNQRSTLIYLIDELLLRDSASGISTAVKNLCCYILARAAENSVLTAHSAFLANRFGASDKQLAACTDANLLQAMQDLITSRGYPSNANSSSSLTSSEDEIALEPLPLQPVRRRRRSDRFRYSEFTVGVVIDESLSDSGGQGSDEEELSNEFGDPVQRTRPKNPDLDTVPSAPLESPSGHSRRRDISLSPSRQRNLLSDFNDRESESARQSNSSHKDESSDVDVPLQPSYLLPDDPEVPEVDGLNSMSAEDFAHFRKEEYNDEGVGMAPPSRQVGNELDGFWEEDQELDMNLFSTKEVSFLLLAHQIAHSSQQNSKASRKYTGATPDPLVTTDLAKVIHNQFDPEAIMEMISVIGAFSFLLRWTVCYPYRPGALEAPVRRFVQTPIAHDLCVDSVGQRTNSKQSFSLRIQTGRSFKIPRHAAA